MNWNDLKTKFTSRKFLVAVAGIIGGIALLAAGNTTEGATMIATSVVAYLAAEGLIDMAAVKNAADEMDDSDYID
ncbi:MAG: hypothetical protein IJB19_00215 [Clostridia bacterium]|nr:hypothetical protein [Clostridia bacterium]